MNYINWNLNVCFIFHTMYMRAVPSQRKHHSAPTPNLYAKKYQKFDSQSNIITAHIDFAIDWTITKAYKFTLSKNIRPQIFIELTCELYLKKVMAAQGTKNTMHCLYIITYTHKHNRVMSLFHSLPQMLLWKFPFLLLSTVF